MLRLKIILFSATVFLIAESCGNSDTSDSQTSTATTSDVSSLIVPDTAPSTSTATTTTITDTWVLDSINGKAPDSNFFAHGSPYFDFDTEKNTISGFTGCNGINGNIKVMGEKITFDSLTVSSQTCTGKGKDFEKKLLAGFRSGKTTYTIKDEKLYLNAGAGYNLILRKIRR